MVRIETLSSSASRSALTGRRYARRACSRASNRSDLDMLTEWQSAQAEASALLRFPDSFCQDKSLNWRARQFRLALEIAGLVAIGHAARDDLALPASFDFCPFRLAL